MAKGAGDGPSSGGQMRSVALNDYLRHFSF